MSERGKPLSDYADDDATIGLLRLADPRAPMPAARAARVRSAVLAEWQARTRRRASRKRLGFASVLVGFAALLLVVGRGTLQDRPRVPSGEPVAVVDRVEGNPNRVFDDGRNRVRLQRDEAIRIGEWIETGERSRVALRFADGTSVRLDTGSRVRPLAPGAIEMSAGAVYLDSGTGNSRFEVRTALAIARDIGTQFEVRLIAETLRLRVRTGVVELSDDARSISGRAGTEIILSPTDAVSRPVATHGSEWDWTTRVSPPLKMEGMALATFLERVAREQGWTVEYRDVTIAPEAARVVLHGSVDGLAPQDAVEVAIAASGLRHRLESGVLVVLRMPPGGHAPGGR